MASKSRKSQQPSLFYLFFFILAAVVIGIVLKATQQTQLSQSRATYSPLERCLSSCDKAGSYINSGACKLDCPAVVAGTMNCTQFCTENAGPARTSAFGVCLSKCSDLNTDPCGQGGMCAGLPRECQVACNSVKNGVKTCAQAFTQPGLRSRCINTFGEGN